MASIQNTVVKTFYSFSDHNVINGYDITVKDFYQPYTQLLLIPLVRVLTCEGPIQLKFFLCQFFSCMTARRTCQMGWDKAQQLDPQFVHACRRANRMSGAVYVSQERGYSSLHYLRNDTTTATCSVIQNDCLLHKVGIKA